MIDAGTYLLVRSAQRVYLFPTWQKQTSPGRARLWPARQFMAGFSGTLFPVELAAGTYQVMELAVTEAGQTTLHATRQTITSVGPPVTTAKKNW